MNYKAYGRKRPMVMNKIEQRYARHLEGLKYEGKILCWAYESLKLRLADNTFYTPDFYVLDSEGLVCIKEVKGTKKGSYFCLEPSKVKIKVAADKYPFQFAITWLTREGWQEEII